MRHLIAQRVANALRHCASERGIPLERLKDVLGVERSRVFEILAAGETANPSAELLRKVVDASGVSSDWLLGLDVEMLPAKSPVGQDCEESQPVVSSAP